MKKFKGLVEVVSGYKVTKCNHGMHVFYTDICIVLRILVHYKLHGNVFCL